mmetsp:Transcript_17270/g.33651  ORF Transcript_17270/g.33651 Transcript_17270/m.33651 type:complete len:225 (-) Transcript_17270:3682-4356(-)
MKFQNILETEVFVLVKLFARCGFEVSPVTFLHERRMQQVDQGQDGQQIFDFSLKSHENFPSPHFFWHGVDLDVELFALIYKVVGINVVPKSFFPIFKLVLDDGNHIPDLFEHLVFSSALFDLGMFTHSKLKDLFQINQNRCFFFFLSDFVVVLIDFCVSFIDTNFVAKGSFTTELAAKIRKFIIKSPHSKLDLVDFIVLKSVDLLLYLVNGVNGSIPFHWSISQ